MRLTAISGAPIVAATALAPAAWGSTYLVTTLALPNGYPLWSGALPAGVLALGVGRAWPRGAWWWKAVVLGVLNIGAFFPLLFLAAYLLPGGIAAIFGAAGPLVVAALALPLLGERPTTWRLVWATMAVVGVAVMVTAPGASLNPTGAVAGLAATGSMALGTVLSKRWGRPTGPAAYAGWQLSAGGLLILPVAVMVEGPPPHLDTAAVAGYAWLGLIGAALAYTLWFRGVGYLPVGAVAFLPLISPLVAATLGWVVLGQGLTPLQGAGFTLALLAVASAQHIPTLSVRTARPISCSTDHGTDHGATHGAGPHP